MPSCRFVWRRNNVALTRQPPLGTDRVDRTSPIVDNETMRRRVTTVLISILLCVLAQPGASGDQGTDFFESRIRPILIKRCYECHSSASADVGGGLLLDSRASIRRGGDRERAMRGTRDV